MPYLDLLIKMFNLRNIGASGYTLVDVFRPHDLQHLRAFSPELWNCSAVAASLATLAMGDTNSVSFGQASHVGLALASGAVSVSQLLTLRGRLPRSPLCLGIVIDDLVVLERVARGQALDLAACHSPRVVALLKHAYSSAKLPTHPKKSFFMDKVAHFWGADVFGKLGLAQPSWTRLIPLAFITLAAASLPTLSISLLETLAGSWISVLTFRRRALCLLQEVQHLRSSSGLVEATCSLRRELFTLCALAPLVCTDMRAATSGYLVASDASDDLGAFVSAQVAYPLARELRRHTPAKGLWASFCRLVRPYFAVTACCLPTKSCRAKATALTLCGPSWPGPCVSRRWLFSAAADLST